MKENILGVKVNVTTYSKLKKLIDEDIKTDKKKMIIAINPEKILKARKDKKLQNMLNNADYTIPDGIGVIYASKLKKGNIKSRITGIDCMEMLCSLASEKKYKIFMYGAKKEIINKAKDNIEKKYPGINIVGTIDGYETDNDKIIKEINATKPNIIFVALGSPKQENWILNNIDKLNCNIYQGVGGSFDVFSGAIKRAPKQMQKMGLEWLYRLYKEPKRIFRQLNLIKFIVLVIFYRKKDIK